MGCSPQQASLAPVAKSRSSPIGHCTTGCAARTYPCHQISVTQTKERRHLLLKMQAVDAVYLDELQVDRRQILLDPAQGHQQDRP